MSKFAQLDEPPIRPIYSQASPNLPVELGNAEIQFTHRDTTHRETAKVVMHFLPSARLWFVIPMDVKLKFSMFGQDDGVSFTLTEGDASIDVLYRGFDFGEGPGTFTPKRSPVTIGSSSEAMFTAVFHLFNFPDFCGPDDYILLSGEPPHHGMKRCGRIVLKGDGWNITIAAFDKTSDFVKSLREQGGYIITHAGKIEREDGADFSAEELEDLLRCVHLFLSFALGRWVGVAFPIGLDADGNRVFEQWGLPRTTSGGWHGSFSWFDDRHGELLSNVFSGFYALWNNDSWKKHLRKTLYWYLAANERGTGIGVDAGIILAQTALEHLAWVHCVEHHKIVSKKAFKPRGLSAADRLRMLASTLGIPVEIPPTMRALHGRQGNNWRDIPDAVTWIRNALVHPCEKKPPPEGSYYEAWHLSMWLLDLTLLHLCGHEGDYGNRLVKRYAGTVEQVPWSKQAVTRNEGVN